MGPGFSNNEKTHYILVSDKNTKFVLLGLLPRFCRKLNLSNHDYDIFIHPNRDPGIYREFIIFLRPFILRYQYALIFMDREGCGQEKKSQEEIYQSLKHQLEINGWRGRVEVIVLDPELEIWAWVNSVHPAKNLGWNNFMELKDDVIEAGFWQ